MSRRHRPQPSSSWAALQASHRSAGNTIRAAVLGANDGLVSNLSLVAGVTGASLAAQTILITGFAGLAAGSCAMAMGEWISVQTSREVNERELRVEKEELERFPGRGDRRAGGALRIAGLGAGRCQAADRMRHRERPLALEVMAREELGIDPGQLGGSPCKAATSSFAMFGVGPFVPLVPFFFASGRPALITSLMLSAIVLLALEAGVTTLTGRSPRRSAIRQLLFGLGAAAITCAIGRAVGGCRVDGRAARPADRERSAGFLRRRRCRVPRPPGSARERHSAG